MQRRNRDNMISLHDIVLSRASRYSRTRRSRLFVLTCGRALDSPPIEFRMSNASPMRTRTQGTASRNDISRSVLAVPRSGPWLFLRRDRQHPQESQGSAGSAYSGLASRLMRSWAASRGGLLLKRTSNTACEMGISTPSRSAKAQTARVVYTPSGTMGAMSFKT